MRARSLASLLIFLAAGVAQAQNCPTIDAAEQRAKEEQCRAAGGEWARFGVHAHLCNIYSCAARTSDAGKPCRNRLECEHLCVTGDPPRIGAEAAGRCTAVKTTFGCFTHVDDGRIVGRVCVD
jgi:hypothetical protein